MKARVKGYKGTYEIPEQVINHGQDVGYVYHNKETGETFINDPHWYKLTKTGKLQVMKWSDVPDRLIELFGMDLNLALGLRSQKVAQKMFKKAVKK
jgi:hypothetical protein